MHIALYRKYRPETFDDVCGQDHIINVLKNEVSTNSVNHAYLFSGSRGTGKTTCAKILAKAVNCPNSKNGNPCCTCDVCKSIDSGLSVDVVEMDAASYNGVDNIRDIKENVNYSASSVKNKVFIIDEVHMLSNPAFNALLKTLEEPPQNVIFVLATTEIHKIPATILSRCQRFEFKRIPTSVLVDRLMYIADCEKIKLERSAANLIAILSKGGMRDAIGMLELCAASNDIVDINKVRESVGIAGLEDTISLFKSLISNDMKNVFDILNRLYLASKSMSVLVEDTLSFYRYMSMMKTGNIDRGIFDLTDDEYKEVAECSKLISFESIQYHVEILERCLGDIKKDLADPLLLIDVAFIEMSNPLLNSSPKALLARIEKLENSRAFVPVQTVRDISTESVEPSSSSTHENEDNTPDAVNVTYFSELIADISKEYPMLAGFLKDSALSVSGSTLSVEVKSQIYKDMIEDGSYPDTIIGIAKKYDSNIDKLNVNVMKSSVASNPFDMFVNENPEG